MRKIEKQMVEALNNGDNWCLANTKVISDGEGLSWVYLHGHMIALSVDGIIEPIRETLLKWPTRTTMSRLRALGVDVCKRRGDIYLDGEKLA
jgi:hypothetical protein